MFSDRNDHPIITGVPKWDSRTVGFSPTSVGLTVGRSRTVLVAAQIHLACDQVVALYLSRGFSGTHSEQCAANA